MYSEFDLTKFESLNSIASRLNGLVNLLMDGDCSSKEEPINTTKSADAKNSNGFINKINTLWKEVENHTV